MLAAKADGALRRVFYAAVVAGAFTGGCFPPAPTICGSRTLCEGFFQPFPPCFDLSSDPWHCGACDRFCPFGSACIDGECSCPPGESVCGFSCVDLATDDWNCGACGVACGAGHCASGSCACEAGPGIVECAGSVVCADTSSDPRNCGACGAACPLLDEACLDGVCGCPPGTTLCSSQDVCADLHADVSNCGACGAACDGVCESGTCQPSPPPPPPPCGGFLEPCCGVTCDFGYSCDGLSCS